MAKLSYKERKKMPKKSFALPSKRKGGKGGYPIPDKSHARNALARVSAYGTPSEKKTVRAKVHAKFPSIGKQHGGNTLLSPSSMKGQSFGNRSALLKEKAAWSGRS